MDKICWSCYLWRCQGPSLGGSPFCEREAPAKGAETRLPQREALSTNSPTVPEARAGRGGGELFILSKPGLLRASSFPRLTHSLGDSCYSVCGSLQFKTSFAPVSAVALPLWLMEEPLILLHAFPLPPSTPHRLLGHSTC